MMTLTTRLLALVFLVNYIWLPFYGRSIIHNNWVLTTANCMDGRSASEVYVIVRTRANLDNPKLKQFKVPVTKIIMHHDYDDSLIQNRNGEYFEKIKMAKPQLLKLFSIKHINKCTCFSCQFHLKLFIDFKVVIALQKHSATFLVRNKCASLNFLGYCILSEQLLFSVNSLLKDCLPWYIFLISTILHSIELRCSQEGWRWKNVCLTLCCVCVLSQTDLYTLEHCLISKIESRRA